MQKFYFPNSQNSARKIGCEQLLIFRVWLRQILCARNISFQKVREN